MNRHRRYAVVVGLGLLGGSCHASGWDLDDIMSMKTPPDPPLAGPVVISPSSEALDAQRAACHFGEGASATETLGAPSKALAQIPIRHVIVVMRENRSFDHLFGALHVQEPEVEAIPDTFANLDATGQPIRPFHATTTCLASDPAHQWNGMHADVNDGAMDGFVTTAASSTDTNGAFVMSFYDETDLPFYSWLARTYATADRHFAPLRSGTDPNRDFLLFGTNAGIRETGPTAPDPSTPSILRALMDAGYTWGSYSDDPAFSGALKWSIGDPGTHTEKDLLDALDHGMLPNVAFVDGVDSKTDDHPPGDLQVGEAWLHQIYDHAVRSPQWKRTALVWTYDESGGFADHVPPPDGCAPSLESKDRAFFERGARVSFVVVSPYSKPGYVSHVVQDHTAITRFIEAIFGLPALTRRDANSSALLELFDFASPPALLTPPDAPASGTNGCQ